jgi:hypothetical protein
MFYLSIKICFLARGWAVKKSLKPLIQRGFIVKKYKDTEF